MKQNSTDSTKKSLTKHKTFHNLQVTSGATTREIMFRNDRNYANDLATEKKGKRENTTDHYIEEKYIQLNHYRLMEEIGQGSYGIVKLAYNEMDKNLYALKVLDKMKLLKNFACFKKPPVRRNQRNLLSANNDPMRIVQREIAILKKLCHKNIVKLVEVFDDPDDKYIFMVFELMERGSVLEIPTDKPLKESIAWKYFRDTLQGLEYLHFQKIVHRDIKPSNLLLSETGRVKIADFGVSCEFEGIDAFLSGTAGTPAFMAPEALIEESSYFYSGRAQDIWSLGITLYALLIGNVPFQDNYVIALHKKIKTEPVVFSKETAISDCCKDLILNLLKKDPGHRIMLPEIKDHQWITKNGVFRLPSESENCNLITVTDEEIKNSLRVVPRLDTLILVKAMVHRGHFGNPFRKKRTPSIRKAISANDTSFECGVNGTPNNLFSPNESFDMVNVKLHSLLLNTRTESRMNTRSSSQVATSRL